jgi:hypothetical protein
MPSTPPPAPAPASRRLGLGGVTFGREIDRKTAMEMMDHAHQARIQSPRDFA